MKWRFQLNKFYLLVLTIFVASCMNLPGRDVGSYQRYILTVNNNDCSLGGTPINFSITNLSATLSTNRIALKDLDSGQVSYLEGMRWADDLDVLLEQQISSYLECRGYSVITSPRVSVDRARLDCEVREFNLSSKNDQRNAEVAFSCMYSLLDESRFFVGHSKEPVDGWSASNAIVSISMAYTAVLEDLVSFLELEGLNIKGAPALAGPT